MKFQFGQNVYTAREIRGWFDYSLQSSIPANTFGVIVGVVDHPDGLRYSVRFKKEFGILELLDSDLKVG